MIAGILFGAFWTFIIVTFIYDRNREKRVNEWKMKEYRKSEEDFFNTTGKTIDEFFEECEDLEEWEIDSKFEELKNKRSNNCSK